MSKKPIIAIAALGVLIAMLAASVAPAFLRAGSTPAGAPCVNNLLQIHAAKHSWALDNGKSTNDTPAWGDIRPFLNPTLKCPQGGTLYFWGKWVTHPSARSSGHHTQCHNDAEPDHEPDHYLTPGPRFVCIPDANGLAPLSFCVG